MYNIWNNFQRVDGGQCLVEVDVDMCYVHA